MTSSAEAILYACPYKKALLVCGWQCARSRRAVPAVAASIGCTDASAAQRCTRLMELVRDQARFTLGRSDPDAPLTNGQVMKLQCGGLAGLRDLVSKGEADDVVLLIERVEREYGALEKLPFGTVLRQVAEFSLRERRRRP